MANSDKRLAGTVKWFDNRKGYGFIVPASETELGAPEIFVHHTSISSEGTYRTLVENTAVEFSVEKESGTGKLKALNVTGPSGEALKPPPRKRGTRRKKELANGHDADEPRETKPRRKKEEKKPQDPPFYEDLEDSVKESLNERGFDLGSKNTLDVAFGDERVKLGQGKYAGLATASAVIAEGDYSWKANGTITFTWNRALKFEKDSWAKFDVSKLRATLSLADEKVTPVKVGEDPDALWGAGKPDPKDALIEHEFLMRRVVLTRAPRTKASTETEPKAE